MMITLSKCFTLKLGVGTPHQTIFYQFVCLTKLTVDLLLLHPTNHCLHASLIDDFAVYLPH